MWPYVSICVGIPECVNANKAKQLGDVTCSGTRSARGAAEEDAETLHGLQQVRRSSQALSLPLWLVLAKSIPRFCFLGTPERCGCLGNYCLQGVLHAPTCWRYVISATTLDGCPIPAPLRFCFVRSDHHPAFQTLWIIGS